MLVGSGSGLDDLMPRLEDVLGVPVFAPAEAELALARGAALASAHTGVGFGDVDEHPDHASFGQRRRQLALTGPLAMLAVGMVTFVAARRSHRLPTPRSHRRLKPAAGTAAAAACVTAMAASAVLRLVLRVAIVVAVVFTLVAVESTSRSGVVWRLITFTYQANVLAAAYYLWTLASPRADARVGLRGAVVLYLLMAGAVWNLFLTERSMG